MLLTRLTLVLACVGAVSPAAGQSAEPPAVAQQQGGQETQPASVDAAEPEIRPRFELYAPSVRKLLEETVRSRCGVLATPLRRMLLEMGTVSSEGVDAEEAVSLLEEIKTWPDTSIRMVTYAPDSEGRPRWVIRFDWPLEALHGRVAALLESGAAKTILEGVTLREDGDGRGYKIALPEITLACLLPADESGAYLASHPDLEIPAGCIGADSGGQSDPADLLVCRLNLAGTEKDSGGTALSAFRAVTAIEYRGRVDEHGDWAERVDALWPPISGMGAKALFGKLKQTFFVPDTAFAALGLNSGIATGMLDAMVGFGPQVMMDTPGQVEIVGEAGPGPIGKRAGSQACLALLPGTGFLPMPDVVIQLRTKRPDKLVEDIRAAAEKANKLFKDREQPEPWHEAEIRDRAVFWSDGGGQYRGMMMPVVLRPVLFVTKELDARERERDFVVLAWTSTSPKDLVRRWLDLPRHRDRRYLPSVKKSNGQLWINWSQAYKWLAPYFNVALSGMNIETLLPRAEEIETSLTDAELTAKAKYSGLVVRHTGPLPVGALLVPALFGASMAADESGGSDLARERLASRRLRTLHHHCKLFFKDMRRWPAEIAELDGYIDFAGHPELLRLKLSPKRRWTERLKGITEAKRRDQEFEEDEEQDLGFDTDLYVIDWGRHDWTLGYAPGTFEHLDKLYIDQDGRIHRVEKKEPSKPEDTEAGEPSATPTTGPSAGAQAN